MCVCTCVYARMYEYMCVCMYVYVRTYERMCVCMYVRTCVRMCVAFSFRFELGNEVNGFHALLLRNNVLTAERKAYLAVRTVLFGGFCFRLFFFGLLFLGG